LVLFLSLRGALRRSRSFLFACVRSVSISYFLFSTEKARLPPALCGRARAATLSRCPRMHRRVALTRAAGAGRPSTPSTRPRRPPPGVRLRRSDLPLGRPQPWDLEFPTSLAGLGIVKDDDEAEDAPLAVRLAISEAGGGYLLRGRVVSPAPLRLPCDGCGAPVAVCLDEADAAGASFQVWLDPGLGGGGSDDDGGDADALPWPPHRAAVDLTAVAAAAAAAALPTRRSCGAPTCVLSSGGAVALEAREAGGGGGGGGGGAFGKLAGLKARLARGP
jgi:hypothetical protein